MTRHRSSSNRITRSAGDRGQAVVELALALPFCVMVLLGVAQVIVVGVNQLAVVHTARDAVRSAAVSADPVTAARLAVDRQLPDARVETLDEADTVTVVVTLRDPTDVPVIGVVLPPVDLRARATMSIEGP